MLYKFRSKVAADVIMMGPTGDQILRIIGKEPEGRGILDAAGMPAAIQAIEAAITREETQAPQTDSPADELDASGEEVVGLRQRAWPLVEMKRAHAEGEEVVWAS